MEALEHRSLEAAPFKPSVFSWYVHTFIVWPHGRGKRDDFLSFCNGFHQNIQLTMEVEVSSHLPFLDVLVCYRCDDTLGCRVYCKPIHTALYLNQGSFYHQAQKRMVLKTLVHRARMVSDQDNVESELTTPGGSVQV